MTRITEKRDVQDQLINHLIGIGWCYQPPVDVAAEAGRKAAWGARFKSPLRQLTTSQIRLTQGRKVTLWTALLSTQRRRDAKTQSKD